jgi:hypothetical protein
MNIKEGLKEKNKLSKTITKLIERINKNNSMDVGGVRSYDPHNMLEELFQSVEQLVELKTKIHTANVEVYDKIFRMSEYKSLVTHLRGINCTEGTIVIRGYGESTQRNLTTVITEVERDTMIEDLERKIDELQSELDYHNVVKHI